MILGRVNERREAVIPVTVHGLIGTSATVDAVIDTGFDDFLSLPLETIAALALPAGDILPVRLSDGSVIQVMHFEAEVDWHGQRKPVIVQAAPNAPLVGMSLLEGDRLIVEAEPGGLVKIQQRRRRV